MPNAYEELMRSVGEHAKSESFKRGEARAEEERKKKAKEAAERAAKERAEAEKRGGTGGRMREGYERRNELLDAVRGDRASDTLGAPKEKKKPAQGGVRG